MRSQPSFFYCSLQIGNALGRFFAAVDALRDADAVVGVAGQREAGVLATRVSIWATRCRWPTWYCGIEAGQRAMSVQSGLAGDLHEVGEFAVGDSLQLVGGQFGQLRVRVLRR